MDPTQADLVTAAFLEEMDGMDNAAKAQTEQDGQTQQDSHASMRHFDSGDYRLTTAVTSALRQR